MDKNQVYVFLRIKPPTELTQQFNIFAYQNKLLYSKNLLYDFQAQELLQDKQGSTNKQLFPSVGFLEFDNILGTDVLQSDVFQITIEPTLTACLQSKQSSCFLLFGPQGSGKSYTLRGGEGTERGIMLRAAEIILDYCVSRKYILKACGVQIYLTGITDLLSGITQVKNYNLSSQIIKSIPEFHQFLSKVLKTRDKKLKNKIHLCIQLQVCQSDKKDNIIQQYTFLECAGSELAAGFGDVTNNEKSFLQESFNTLATCLVSIEKQKNNL